MKTQKLRYMSLIFAVILMISAVGFTSCSDEVSVKPTTDREGNTITLPDKIETIISVGSSNTEILVALGFADKIVAIDTFSADVESISSDVPQFDQYAPDGEQIISLEPDVIFVTSMAKSMGDDPYKLISDSGICVVYIPSSTSIAAIKDDIRYIADVMEVSSKGDEIIKDMEKQIDEIKAIGDAVTDKKTVYFEISAAPYMYSLGSGTFINEMIEIIGAENIFANQADWIYVVDESIFEMDPDIILTSVDYVENPTDEIKSRAGWDALTAVRNDDVYTIDTNASNRPSQNIIKALRQMAEAVYPEFFK